jgi:hypothetical protein
MTWERFYVIEDFSANVISSSYYLLLGETKLSKRMVSRIMLALLLISMLTLAFNIQSLKADRPRDGGGASRETSKYASGVTITYYFSEPKIEEDRDFMHACLFNKRPNSYVSVTMDGLPQYEQTALPVLPFKTAKILLPFGTRFEHVGAIGGKKMPLLGSYLVEYGQEPVPFTTVESADALTTNLPNEMVYGSAEPFPGKLYSDVSVQSKMGYKILLVNLYPVEYIPETGKLFYYESIGLEVEVISENGGENSAFDRYLQHREIVEDMVDNPEVLETYPTSEQTPTYQYVIITNEELNSTLGPCNFQALRDDKISRGISATIVTVEWIYANYNGTRPDGGHDNQTRIRNFIIDAHNNWGIMYVLLGGDGDGGDVGGESGDTIIPHRGFSASYGEDIDNDIPADMYYGCLDGTFDYDGNGVYGEPNDGPDGAEVDLFAEVYVGRTCVDSQVEVQNFVNKTLSYQTAAATADAHLGKVWMVGENLTQKGLPEWWGGNSKDEIKEGSNAHGYTTVGFENSPYATGFDVSTLYDRDYPGNEWPKSEVISVINDNVHLMNHLGHTNMYSMMRMNNPDVDTLLTNDELYFIGYSQGCYCGAFDNRYPLGSHAIYDCISEHLTTEAHGAVAFISNSRYGLGVAGSTDGASQHYDREFWDAVLGEDIFNIGIANQDSKEDNAGRVSYEGDRYCYYEINLFGDPELMIVLPLSARTHLVVRGLNNRIYYRSYNSSSDSWNSWDVLLTGVTCDSPAATVCCGKLHIVVRGFSRTNIYANYSLWYSWTNLTDNNFSGWTRLSGATESAPTLVCYDPWSVIVLVVRGMNNRIYYRSYDCVSDAWEEWTALPSGATCDSPAATILDDELHIVVRGFSATSVYGNCTLWHGFLDCETEVFSGWERVGGATESAPTLAASQALNYLVLFVRGLNNRIYYTTYNGIPWTALPSGATCDSPAATIVGDELHIVVRDMSGTSLWHYYINLSTSGHSGWNRISGATPSAPTLTH